MQNTCMKFLVLVFLSVFTMSFTNWDSSFTKAKAEANTEHKYILLNFSGSDWCGPCIRLHKEFFDNEVFAKFAESNLVLMNADFPRQKKNQLPAEVQKQNDQLAEKYNAKGAFPYTVLLDANGKVVKSWDGLPKEKPEEFTNEISALVNATK
jgi:thioredoxin-related protein